MKKTIVTAIAVLALAACGSHGSKGWTDAEDSKINDKISELNATASQQRCIVDYVESHWSFDQVSDSNPKAEERGFEAGKACIDA